VFACEEIRSLHVGLLAIRDVTQHGEVATEDEMGAGAVLDVAGRALRTDDTQFAALVTGREKPLPGGVEIGCRSYEEIVEASTEELVDGPAEQVARCWVRIDEDTIVVNRPAPRPGRP
jgi:hypothetical protein